MQLIFYFRKESFMSNGYLCLVLHAHLPYVRHPEHEKFLEERWLYEAITETYIPLIQAFDRLIEDNIGFRLTMTLSPPLISMLTDPLLQERYINHLAGLIELADKEESRTYGSPFHEAALMYKKRLREAMFIFRDRYHRNIVSAFKKFQHQGRIEIITCAATHGYLPLMLLQPEAVKGQIKAAVDLHTRHLGRPPRGIWLPECGYAPGIDELLKENGIKYFFADSHGDCTPLTVHVLEYSPQFTAHRGLPHSAGTSNRLNRSGAARRGTQATTIIVNFIVI
jgi:1,4-alpha-glucan branching enzyme